MISRGIIDKYITKIRNEILKNCNNLIHDYPIHIYVNDMKSYGESYSYKYFSPKIKTIFNEILKQYNFHILALYQKFAIATFIKDSNGRLHNKDFPESILRIYQEWFKRVLEDFSIQPDDYYNYENDAFQKDLSVCSLRLFPVGGSWIVDKLGSLGRKHLFAGGIRQFFNCLMLSLFKTGGRKPFYLIHTVDRYLDRFNPEERDKCYLRIGELLKRNSKIKGLMATCWLYDPMLEKISPRLAFLRQRPEQNGAKVFRIGTRQFDIDMALLKSPTRRKLYKKGKYIPVCHSVVWPRRELIAWADKQTSNSL
jgi:hypothetical protein